MVEKIRCDGCEKFFVLDRLAYFHSKKYCQKCYKIKKMESNSKPRKKRDYSRFPNYFVRRKTKEIWSFVCPVCGKTIEHNSKDYVKFNSDIHLKACKLKRLKEWNQLNTNRRKTNGK